jgi:hypothetical protein
MLTSTTCGPPLGHRDPSARQGGRLAGAQHLLAGAAGDRDLTAPAAHHRALAVDRQIGGRAAGAAARDDGPDGDLDAGVALAGVDRQLAGAGAQQRAVGAADHQIGGAVDHRALGAAAQLEPGAGGRAHAQPTAGLTRLSPFLGYGLRTTGYGARQGS